MGYQVDGVDSCHAPIQQFHWVDEFVEPDHAYTYTVSTMVGTPDSLVERDTCIVTLQTARATSTDVALVFNRGITATPAYRTQFDTVPPNGQPATLRAQAEAYLSRGLRESLLAFLDASRAGDALDIAIYEFQDAAVVASLLSALDRGVAVRVIAHAKDDQAGQANAPFLAALRQHQSPALVVVERRRVRGLSHNKLVVHRVNGRPVRVWCGSTNFSARGFFSQTNVGITLSDPALAQWYGTYIELLAPDPRPQALRAAVTRLNAASTAMNRRVFFSPSDGPEMLDTIAAAIRSARDVVLLSCPFGLDQTLVDALGQLDQSVLVYGILNTNQRGDLTVIHRDGR